MVVGYVHHTSRHVRDSRPALTLAVANCNTGATYTSKRSTEEKRDMAQQRSASQEEHRGEEGHAADWRSVVVPCPSSPLCSPVDVYIARVLQLAMARASFAYFRRSRG